MKKQDRTKKREKLEVELKEFRKLSRVHRTGRQWLREIREALGMSVTEMACRLDCSRGLVYRIEQGERDGGDRLAVMQELAQAMHCKLIYAIVPWHGKTLEETAAWVKASPQWQTEKQEERMEDRLDEEERKWHEEHREWVQEQREERARARREAEEAAKMAAEWAADNEQRATRGHSGNGADRKSVPPTGWWTAKTAESMKEQNIPGDWALRMALARVKADGEGRDCGEQRDGLPDSGAGSPDASSAHARRGDACSDDIVMDRVVTVKDGTVSVAGLLNGRSVQLRVRAVDSGAAEEAAKILEESRGKKLREIPGLRLRRKGSEGEARDQKG